MMLGNEPFECMSAIADEPPGFTRGHPLVIRMLPQHAQSSNRTPKGSLLVETFAPLGEIHIAPTSQSTISNCEQFYNRFYPTCRIAIADTIP